MDIFDAAWNEEPIEETAEETTAETAEDTAEEATEETTEEASEETTETTAEESVEEPKAESFPLKYMKEERSYTRDETIALAQKGLDYDRIRQERDTLKPQIAKYQDMESFLNELAKDSGVTVDKLMEDVRTQRLIERERAAGNVITDTAARAQVQADKLHTEPKEEPVEEHKDEPAPDVLAFCRAYPDVQAKDIPQSVWEEVRGGVDLVSAYTRYENKQLKTQLEAMKTNEKNKKRTAGSMQSSGGTVKKDMFDTAWEAADV